MRPAAWVMVVVLALLVITLLTTVESKKKKSRTGRCKKVCGKGNKGKWQSCETCSGYIVCDKGDMIHKSCPSGLVWDDKKKSCRPRSRTCKEPPPVETTTTTTTSTTEPTTTTEFVPPRPGFWSLWDSWSDCDEDCGGGTQERSRACDNPAPQGGGQDCVGRSHESRACNTFDCPDCDPSRVCPTGCTPRSGECGICHQTGNTVNGQVNRCGTNTPIGSVEVYNVKNLLDPLAVTAADGSFTITDICGAGLELSFYKVGHTSEQETYTSPFTVEMCENHITFVTHPQHTAVFEGDDVTLTCLATGVPGITHYDWFKDFAVISYGDEVPGDNSMYTISAATESDSGVYQCRAVSPLLQKLSMAADVIVRADGDDTCAEQPLPKTEYLEDCTAKVDGEEVTQFNVGVCAGTACAIRGQPQDPTMCCERKTSDVITVDCGTFTYNITRTLTCGCGPCSDAQDVEVSGAVKYASAEDPNNHLIPDKQLLFYVGSNAYYTAADGTFTRVLTAVDDRVVLQFRGGRFETYIANLATIMLEADKTEYTICVVLQTLPEPILLDPTQENVLEFGTSGGQTAMATLTIPANSITFLGGALVTGTVRAYQTFDDPRLDDGLALAPGEFAAVDSDGFFQFLETGGVLGLHLVDDTSGQTVILPGDVELQLDLSQGAGGMSTWQLDNGEGNWNNPAPVDGGGAGRRRKKRQAGSTDTSFPAGSVQKINYDRINVRDRCWVRVYVYRDLNCTIPASSISVWVYTKDFLGPNTVARTIAYTDSFGTACVVIPCDRQHEILLSTQFQYKTSATHKLPFGFGFTNSANEKRVFFSSPPANDPLVTGGDGPVHKSTVDCKDRTDPDYHFKFTLTNYPKPGKLYPTEPIPGLPDSWYPEPATSDEREACMVRIRVDTFDEMEALATSFRGDTSGFNYGYYETGMMKYYNQYVGYHDGHRFACVEVKCPGDRNMTGLDPAVAVTVNLKPTPNECKFLKWGNKGGGLIHQTSNTDDRLTFLIDPENCTDPCDYYYYDYYPDYCYDYYGQSGRPSRAARKDIGCYDNRLFYGYGAGRLARNEAFNQCIQTYAPYLARFDCTNGQVAEYYWQTPPAFTSTTSAGNTTRIPRP